jgi:hypothetical protein
MCPTELKVMENENVVACQGACSTDNLEIFCCHKSNFSTSETCDPSSYALTFKTACPHAYSCPYNNGENTFSCSSKLYKIIFCPASSDDGRLVLAIFSPINSIQFEPTHSHKTSSQLTTKLGIIKVNILIM